MISNNPQATRLNDLNDASDIFHLNEQKRYFEYLKTNVATNSMVTEATGIKQKNLTRYKRTFQKFDLLFELYKGICKKTKRRATYLTTNPDLIPQSNQLKMF
jgi:hypothetical protein